MPRIIGVDIGGTFTDLILHDTALGQSYVHKVPSTNEDPSIGMMRGIAQLCASARLNIGDLDAVLHGTTIATNTMLEHKGAKAGMLTTRGFRDVLHIGRHQRPQHYSIMQDIPWQARPMIRRRYRQVVTERVTFPGEVSEPLCEDDVLTAVKFFREEGVESVAIGFLNSYLNPVHENRAREIVQAELPGVFVTTSSELFAQFREFERFSTVAISAFIGPRVAQYLENLDQRLKEHGFTGWLHLMMSNGGVATIDAATRKPITLLQSGPAAGVLGGQWSAARSARTKQITFDMGGTSADIGIVDEHGIIEATSRDTWIAGYPVLAPMLDVYTIGAGGGSIAYQDEGGAFRVGPRSAGATPGPACYGHGGQQPTVTDAHVVLGRIDPIRFLGGEMRLDVAAARAAVGRLAEQLGMGLEETAEGILTIANNAMAAAIRSRTVERGRDPREFTLVAFGGAGPLHAAQVAEILDIREVLVPPYPGINAAVGLLTSDLRYDQMVTLFELAGAVDPALLSRHFLRLEDELRARLVKDGIRAEDIVVAREVECRYVGQGYEIKVPVDPGDIAAATVAATVDRFHSAHAREYGHCFRDDPVEVVNLRVTATGRTDKLETLFEPGTGTLESGHLGRSRGLFRIDDTLSTVDFDLWDRAALPTGETVFGPCVLYQRDTTVVVPPKWAASTDAAGNLILEQRLSEAAR